ncbi:hypothetical protein MVEN_02530200 [Mycena venus]|uniref:Uncharacterized protein n=1 Tax=Mycena venus TaxID=2733690 RepID=A0A8H6WUS8_9AGAR|nr:hypothetical protein MVEN_02530200 [Mycena venus]
MGRWTVAEWLAQAQEFSPLPGGEDDLEYGDGTYPHYIDALLEEDDDEFEDEEDDNDYGKPLPSRPGPELLRDGPPVPPPKTHLTGIHSFPIVAWPPADEDSLLGVTKKSRRTRGKRGKADTIEKLDRSTEAGSDLKYRGYQMATSAGSLPRSPDARRPREFFVQSTVKRVPSQSKSKSKSKPASARDGYTYNGQPLQILVSTQVTATHSPHDAGRPRVFYPRSSSLPSATNNVRSSSSPPPAPPPKTSTPTRARSSRALPALPVASATNAPTNSVHRQASTDSGVVSNGPRRIRPLPVPRTPASPL